LTEEREDDHRSRTVRVPEEARFPLSQLRTQADRGPQVVVIVEGDQLDEEQVNVQAREARKARTIREAGAHAAGRFFEKRRGNGKTSPSRC
jgi:hypothetical protein